MKVAIVGASYAGLSCAKVLGDHDIKTDVFEIKKDISKFNCGEAFISGVYGVPKPPKKSIFYTIRNVALNFPNGAVTDYPCRPDSVFMTDRAIAQEEMFNNINSSVEFHLGTNGRIQQLKNDYDYVIDASGHRAQSSKIGYLPEITNEIRAIFYRIEGDFSRFRENNDIHIYGLKDGGYFWIFPQTDTQANVGYGIKDVKPTFEILNDILTKYLDTKAKILMRGSGIMPMDYMNKVQKGNITVIGEGAGLMNYAVESGTQFAVSSGTQIAEHIVRGAYEQYPTHASKTYLPEVRQSKILANFLYRNKSIIPPSLKVASVKLYLRLKKSYGKNQ